MRFELSEEHEAFRRVVREFAEQEIAPYADGWDHDAPFATELVHKMGELGLFALPFSEEVGGMGGDFTALCVAIEEIGRVDQSMGITLEAGVGLGISPLVAYGSDEQKERYLPDLFAGRSLAGFGLTEADAGSDAGSIRTTARLDGPEWVINGSKAFITNAGTPITSLVTIAANTGPDEVSALVVPAGTEGFVVEPPYRKLGWRGSDTRGLVFENCRVPAANLLGERGRGLQQFLATLDAGRIAIAALATGLAQACLEHSVDYAKTRHAFGRPIGSNQGIAFQVADIQVMVEAARLLTYRAAALMDEGRPVKQAAAVAKLNASEAAVAATRIATQVFGGAGFIESSPVARFYRDAKVLEIGEGTSEIQRLVISRGLGLPVL